MAVLPADLTYPVGEIRTEWFSGEDLSANLSLWIGDGEESAPAGASQAQVDALARSYAYWRAFDAKMMQMAGSPDSAALEGEMSRTITQGRKFFQTKAAFWKAAYDAALSDAQVVADVSPAVYRTSETVNMNVVF